MNLLNELLSSSANELFENIPKYINDYGRFSPEIEKILIMMELPNVICKYLVVLREKFPNERWLEGENYLKKKPKLWEIFLWQRKVILGKELSLKAMER